MISISIISKFAASKKNELNSFAFAGDFESIKPRYVTTCKLLIMPHKKLSVDVIKTVETKVMIKVQLEAELVSLPRSSINLASSFVAAYRGIMIDLS